MNYHRLGNAGIKLSELSLGAWITYGGSVTDKALIRAIVERALAAGVNFFDNADAYSRGEAERLLGEVFAELAVPRHHLVLSSKVYWPMSDDVNDRGLSRKHVLESIDMSLDRMGTDYVDIYFAHRHDDEVSMEEIVEAFSDVVTSGRALYWGTSEWTAAQIAEAHAHAKGNGLAAPVVEQSGYSLLRRERVERDVLPVLRSRGMGLMAFSPLAQGMLSGKYDDGLPEGSRFATLERLGRTVLTDANRRKVRELKKVADELGVSRAQLALAWLLAKEEVATVIIGATRLEQLEENLGALEVELDETHLERIEELVSA